MYAIKCGRKVERVACIEGKEGALYEIRGADYGKNQRRIPLM